MGDKLATTFGLEALANTTARPLWSNLNAERPDTLEMVRLPERLLSTSCGRATRRRPPGHAKHRWWMLGAHKVALLGGGGGEKKQPLK